MATTRPFAKNTGSAINGTTQVGNIASGNPNNGFAATGLAWFNGPNEESGYIVCGESSGNSTPAGANGIVTNQYGGPTANIQFWQAADNTDAAFIELAKKIIPGNYVTTSAAYDALNTGGYWTNFTPPTASGFGYLSISGLSYPMTGQGASYLRIDNPTSIDKYIWLRGNSTYQTSGTNTGSAAVTSGLGSTPTISISNTITGVNQTFDSGSYILVPANTLNVRITISNTGVGSMQLTYTDTNTPAKTSIPAN